MTLGIIYDILVMIGGQMKLSTLRYFVEVATENSFTKASQNLFISQPTLSRRIQELESELGVTLFNRNNTNNIILSPEGKQLLVKVRDVLDQIESISGMFDPEGPNKNNKASIKIGCLTNFDFSKLYDLIEQFKTQYPNVKFIIEQGSPMELNDGLLNRTYDLVLNLDNYISNNDVLKTSLYKNNNLQVAIQNNHRLASKQEIQFSDLTDETLILIERNKSPLVFDYVINQCLKHGFHAKANYYVKNLDEGLSKTSLGEGISFLYSGMDNGYLSKKYRVKFLNLNEEKSSQNLVYAFQENNNPMLDEFLNFVHQNKSDLY